MNSVERHKLSKKARLAYKLAYLIGFGLTIIVFSTIRILPTIDINLVYAIFIVFSFLTPIFTGMGLSIHYGILIQKLNMERKRLRQEKSTLYYQRFCNLIGDRQFEEAKEYYNNFIFGEYRVISHGILLGAIFVSGIDKDWKFKAWDRIIEMK